MIKNRFNLRKGLAIAICLVATTVFTACDNNCTLNQQDFTPLKLNYGRFYVCEEQNDEQYTVVCLELAENDFTASDNRIFYFDMYNFAGVDSLAGSVNRNISEEIMFYGDILAGYIDAATKLPKGTYYREIRRNRIVYEQLIQGGVGIGLRIWDSRNEYYPYDDKVAYRIDGWIPYKEDKNYAHTNTIEFRGEIVRVENYAN